jgi:hypothetical protein
MSKKGKPIIVSVTSDQHGGSTVGLSPPKIELPDGDDRRHGKAQRWLWRNWKFYISKVKAAAEEHNTKYLAVLNGDVIEGNHHHTTQVITNNTTVQQRITEEVLSPLLQDADQAYFIRGTPAHVGDQARLEEKVADNWTNTVKDGQNSTRWHLELDVNGTLFDIGHKGSIGRLPWTKPNAVNKIANIMIIRAHQGGYKAPNVVLRAHWHTYADTGSNFRHIRVIAMPAWQLVTGYVNTIDVGAVADIGGLIFTCWPDKTYDLEVVRFFPKKSRPLKVVS